MSKKHGLRLLKPKFRLLLIIIATSLFAFIYHIEVALGAFFLSTIVLLLGRRLVFKKVFFYILIINTIYMLLGNWLFSPSQLNSHDFGLIKLNDTGLINGIIGALKRNAMIILSFAWLSSVDSLYDIFLSISFFEKFDKTIIVFLKWIQNLKHDFTLMYYSLHLRGFELKSKNPKKKVLQLNVILKAVLNGFFKNIGKMTFSGESHFSYLSNKNTIYKGEIEIINLTVKYDPNNNSILKNINLKIPEGQVVLITGHNQSGKTTLLKAISGYIPKIEGYITNGDVIVSSQKLNSDIPLSKINQFIRYIVENPVDSVIGLNVKQELLSQTSDENKVTNFSNLLNITHLWERDVNTLSGGEQARVVLASLLCSDAKVLILESPLGQLDPSGRKAFITALIKLTSSKTMTIVITDQYADYFDGLIDRIVFLKNGKIHHDALINNKPINDYLNEFELDYPKKLTSFKIKTKNSSIVASMKNVNLSFGDKNVLKNINLNIYNNQSIVIVGNNGSGKSTLALSLAKVLNINSGSIKHFDSNIGMVFQDCSKQVLENNVLDEIILGCKNMNIEKNEEVSFANSLINWSGLLPDKNTLELSASQLRLLEISSNIFKKGIIILDEPTNYLDSSNLIKLHSFIQNLLDQGRTVIIITHDESLASLCNRYILIHDSSILMDSTNFDEILLKRKQIANA